jgi:hypothetical protein
MKSAHGGKRKGSGRKAGITDGRKAITVRVLPKALKRLGPKPAKKIREIVEGQEAK